MIEKDKIELQSHKLDRPIQLLELTKHVTASASPKDRNLEGDSREYWRKIVGNIAERLLGLFQRDYRGYRREIGTETVEDLTPSDLKVVKLTDRCGKGDS
jgi:hypothetical protein